MSCVRVQAGKLLSYGGAGIVGTAMHYCIAFLLWSLAGSPELLATTIGACCGALANYFLAYYLVFSSGVRHSFAFLRFAIVAGFGVLVNAVIFAAFASIAGSIAAQLIATGCVFLIGFYLNKNWSFRD